MSLNDLLLHLTRFFFVTLWLITLLEFILHRDKIRRDVMLVCLSLAASMLINIFTAVTHIEIPINIGGMALLAQPYLLLRLVRYFRPLPLLIERGAIAIMFIGWAMVIRGTPLPVWASITLIIYFAVFDGYAVFAFVQGAFSSTSVTRKRLQFAAAGSALLVATLLVAALRLLLPSDGESDLTPIIQFLAILSALSYYLGFAPPRWLRQAWQLTELRNFLQYTQKAGEKTSTEIFDHLCSAVSRAIGVTTTTTVVLWDEENQKLVIQKSTAFPTISLHLEGVIRETWQKKTPLVLYKSPALSPEDTHSMEQLKAETMLIVPIATNDRVLGLLIVLFQYGSLFIEDDLNLLTIFASQTAVILENNKVIEKLRHYTEDLETKVEERTLALKRSNEELQQFAYVASHDLQEPLRSVISYLQLIEMRYADKFDESGHEFIAFAIEGAHRMKALITDLLAYSRLETEARVLTIVDSQQALDEAYKLLETAINESQANITHDTLPNVKADKRLLVQLFQNLIGNAIKYRSREKPEIHIAASFEDNHWLFSIKDNGIGIEAAYLDRIFTIFQRLHSRSQYPGTGIGLAICKKAVEYHGGRIWADSEIGKGTTFYFTLPV